jgi:hypothetical protein
LPPGGVFVDTEVEEQVIQPEGMEPLILQFPHRIFVWDPVYVTSPSEAHYLQVWHWMTHCDDGPLGTENCQIE